MKIRDFLREKYRLHLLHKRQRHFARLYFSMFTLGFWSLGEARKHYLKRLNDLKNSELG